MPITSRTITLPISVASLYRPNSPIALLQNYTEIYMLFPLPTNLTTTLPNPSIHLISTKSYQPISADWTEETKVIDTGIVPYATGSEEMSETGLRAVGAGMALTIGTGIELTMPRSWAPLYMEGIEKGRVVIFYLSEDGKSLKVGDVLGGSGAAGNTYDVIVPGSGT